MWINSFVYLNLGTMLFTCLLLVSLTMECEGHGRMIEPPQRSSLWRFGFNAPVNTDDHSINCGGMGVLYSPMNKGRCGVCGDRFDMPQPRENEAGGKYGLGIISRNYKEGQIIKVLLEITVAHGGWSEFKLCPNNDIHRVVTQGCLDKHQLKITGSGRRFYHPRVTGIVPVYVELPRGLMCSQCVLQWRWKTDSSNRCNTITKENCCEGCGIQEEFVNCADVSIEPSILTQIFNQSANLGPLLPDQFIPIIAKQPETPVPSVKDVFNVTGYVPLGLSDITTRIATCMATPVWKRFLGSELANMWCQYYCDKAKCPLYLCTPNCQV